MGYASSTRPGARFLSAALVRRFCAIAALSALSTLALAGTAVADQPYVVTQLTAGSAQGGAPVVSSDRVAWLDANDVVTWRRGAITELTDDTRADVDPQVSGGRVVWARYPSDGSDWEIYTWTQSTAVVRITDNTWNDQYPQISGDLVVWQATPSDGTDSEIYTWTADHGILRITDNSTADTNPRVSAGRVVWESYVAGNSEISTWKAGEGITRVTTNTESDIHPQVSGDRIVWQGYVYSDFEIWTWTPVRGSVRLTYNEYDDTDPKVSGSRIVWRAIPSGGDNEIFCQVVGGVANQLTSNNYNDMSPEVDGDLVAWAARPTGDIDYEIYYWRPSYDGPIRLTSNFCDDVSPKVANTWIVWQAVLSGRPEVYLACPPPSITSVTPASGPRAGLNDITIRGTGLMGPAEVRFGDALATSVDSPNASMITCKAPPHATGRVSVTVTTPAGTTSATGSENDYHYLTRFENTEARLLYAGAWAPVGATGPSAGGYARTEAENGYVVVQFSGHWLDWMATKGPDMGDALVSLDGGPSRTVHLYRASTLHQQKVYSTGPLADGGHILRISWHASAGKYINLDAVDVDSGLTTIPSVTHYEQTDTHLTYAPAWESITHAGASGGSFARTNSSGARVSFSFTGVRVNVVARKSPSYGKITVTIDGGTSYTADLYSSTAGYGTVWYSPFLRPGTHTVVIERAGTKNNSSTGYTVGLDALDIRGTLP